MLGEGVFGQEGSRESEKCCLVEKETVDPQANNPRDACSGRRESSIRIEAGGSESLGISPGTSSEIGWSFGQHKGRRLPCPICSSRPSALVGLAHSCTQPVGPQSTGRGDRSSKRGEGCCRTGESLGGPG